MKTPGTGRMKLIGVIFGLLGLLIIAQMFRIQNSASAKELIEEFDTYYNQVVREIKPERGNIYDRWGNLLAGNVEVYEIGIAPQEVYNPETVAKDVYEILGEEILDKSYTELLEIANSFKVSQNEQYVVLADFVPADKIRQFEERQEEYKNAPTPKKGLSPSLRGLHWVPHLRRSYPENTLGANILGFYNYYDRAKGHGIYGLEEYYNNLLAGNAQKVVLPMNPTKIEEIPDIPPGSSLILTIDREIQSAMERIAAQAVEDNGAKSATIIVMAPETGEILAMATTPSFNPNEYWTYKDIYQDTNQPYNRAVSQLYEPGSVFKVLTMAAALDSGAVTPETQFIDTGAIEVGGIWIYNWDRGAWGPQDMTGCMQHSLNVCLSWIAQQMGPSTFYQYLQNFGVGRLTGIDLAGEQVYPMVLPGDSNWYPVNLGTNSFGQGIAVTPLQMVSSISAVANHGVAMWPHLVKAYVKDGVQFEVRPRANKPVIKPETAHTLTEMLAVSLEEEASDALVPGYRVAGKTGTAEIAGPNGYLNGVTNASFVGWGPADDPQFIIYVWVEEPSSSPWGSIVAAPIFSKAAQELTVLMQIPPDDLRHQLSQP